MNVLLDTCAFLWLTLDASELSIEARTVFQNPDNRIYLSSVSIWEILVKNQLGKLVLPDRPAQFIHQQCIQHDIEYLPLDEKAVFELSGLPNIHRDPFDRMLVCQALSHQLSIMTSDPLIRAYSVAVVGEWYAVHTLRGSHGTTVGQLEEQSLFYLQSRGLDLDAARHVLTFAFANEMVDKVDNAAVKAWLVERLLARFGGVEL